MDHGVSRGNVSFLLSKNVEVILGVNDVQLPSNTSILRILQGATLVAMAHPRSALSDIPGATLYFDGTTKHGKQFHSTLISIEGRTYLHGVKYVENSCATIMMSTLPNTADEITK